jgi:AcrR family transcriptional regulator
MTAPSAVTPNRRGVRSREVVLDAAERVMAEQGYDAASVSRIVQEAGIPISSVYHYFGSKEGVLLAVMERGAQRFFADLPLPEPTVGAPDEHLQAMASATIEALERHPNFLRLLIVFAAQPPEAGDGQVHEVVGRVREMALQRLRVQIAAAYGDDPGDATTDQLARFALATIDGAFIARQTDPGASLDRTLKPFAAAIGAVRDSLRAARR